MRMQVVSRRLQALLLLAVLLLLILGAIQFQWNFSILVAQIQQRPVLGAFIYVVALAASIVLLPLSSLILLPLAAEVWGIAIGGTLSALGWWLGALLAFLLSRHVGRPILKWFVSLEKLDTWEKHIPKDVTFMGIVIIRMIFPVDIPSFVLGLFRGLSFKTYAIASLIGIIPFAYLMVAMGKMIALKEWLPFSFLMGCLVATIFLTHRFWIRHR